MYADSRYYREYQRMLVSLHTLIANEAGNSVQASQLRQEMEEPEEHLSREEVIRLNALSGDLSMLHNRDIPDPEIVGRVPPSELPNRLRLAYEQRKWDELLALLRADVSGFLRPQQVAYMRSRAYEAMDEIAPAVAFMDEAARLAPPSANFRALAMELLWKDKRFDEAYVRAKSYLADDAASNRLVLMAAGIISRQVQQDQLPSDFRDTATQAIDRIPNALKNESSPAIRFMGYGALGLLAARVGDRAKAESALQQAIAVEAEGEEQITARGLVLAELGFVQRDQVQTVEERALARQLADLLPDCALAA